MSLDRESTSAEEEGMYSFLPDVSVDASSGNSLAGEDETVVEITDVTVPKSAPTLEAAALADCLGEGLKLSEEEKALLLDQTSNEFNTIYQVLLKLGKLSKNLANRAAIL